MAWGLRTDTKTDKLSQDTSWPFAVWTLNAQAWESLRRGTDMAGGAELQVVSPRSAPHPKPLAISTRGNGGCTARGQGTVQWGQTAFGRSHPSRASESQPRPRPCTAVLAQPGVTPSVPGPEPPGYPACLVLVPWPC